jgi:hypothetical protein
MDAFYNTTTLSYGFLSIDNAGRTDCSYLME